MIMNCFPSFSGEKAHLLSAGPRAGKTRLLLHWHAAISVPKLYLSLTPEDVEADFFRYRLFQAFPEVRERYEALADQIPVSWGARLGMAIAEARPDICLLVDDLQVVEETVIFPEILALFRHFPLSGGLAVASRHQIPPFMGRSISYIGPDHTFWQEQPVPEDLLGLPEPLLGMALVLHLVGESSLSQEGRELLRRGIAAFDARSVLRLREPWRTAAEGALALAAMDGPWDLLEKHLKTLRRAYFRTPQEKRLQKILERVPRVVRENHPFYLQLQGDIHYDTGQIERAQIYYQQALKRAHDQPDRLPDLLIRLAEVALQVPDLSEGASLIHRAKAMLHAPEALQKARIGNAEAHASWLAGRFEAAKDAFQAVFEIPCSDDRSLAHERYFACKSLAKLHIATRDQGGVERYLNEGIALSTEYRLQRDMLEAQAVRLSSMLTAGNPNVFPIMRLLELPNESFAYPSSLSSWTLIHTLGMRALCLEEGALAERYFLWAKQFAEFQGLTSSVHDSNLGLLRTYQFLKRRFAETRPLYDELRKSAYFEGLRHLAQQSWAYVLVESQRAQEAEALLEAELAHPYPEPIRTLLLFHLFNVRHLSGKAGALDEIRALLDSESGSAIWHQEARFIQRLGLRSLPPLFRVHAFGPLSFFKDDQPPPHWPRKKPLSMLGHLLFHPTGMPSEHLAEKLFGDPSDMNSLYTVAYRLRRGLDAESSELLESPQGTYRLKWDRITFCDLHEFDALHEKALALEAEGILHGAALFHGLALRLVEGPLFENLPREFEEMRRSYEQRTRHAWDFLMTHRFPGICEPPALMKLG